MDCVTRSTSSCSIPLQRPQLKVTIHVYTNLLVIRSLVSSRMVPKYRRWSADRCRRDRCHRRSPPEDGVSFETWGNSPFPRPGRTSSFCEHNVSHTLLHNDVCARIVAQWQVHLAELLRGLCVITMNDCRNQRTQVMIKHVRWSVLLRMLGAVQILCVSEFSRVIYLLGIEEDLFAPLTAYNNEPIRTYFMKHNTPCTSKWTAVN